MPPNVTVHHDIINHHNSPSPAPSLKTKPHWLADTHYNCEGSAMKLMEAPFCFLDVETTGLYPEFGDRICEIALVSWRKGKVEGVFHSLVNPQRPISPGAYAVNRITKEMVKDAPLFSKVVFEVLDFIQGKVIVAHNAPFDLKFLSSELNALSLPIPDNPVVDTLLLARRYFRFPSNSLDRIAAFLGISQANHHRALEDALTTKEVFAFFLKEFLSRGLSLLEELLALQKKDAYLPPPVLPPALTEALERGRKLRLTYLSYWGELTTRVVEPLELTTRKDYVYLIAFCHLRQERRTFRLDRIIKLEPG